MCHGFGGADKIAGMSADAGGARYNDHWEVNIFDPVSGNVVYNDRRVASDIYY